MYPTMQSARSLQCKLIVCLLGLMVLIPGYSSEFPSRLTLGTTLMVRPYSYQVNDKVVGIDVSIVGAVLEKMGIEYTVIPAPYKRLIFLAQSGDIDGIVAASTQIRKESKGALIFPEEPSYHSHMNIYGLNGAKALGSVRELNGKRLGYPEGYILHSSIDASQVTTESFRNHISLLKALSKQRIHYFYGEEFPTRYASKNLQLTKQITPVYNFSSLDFYPCFSRQSLGKLAPRFIAEFNRHLIELKHSGEVDKIINQYLGPIKNTDG